MPDDDPKSPSPPEVQVAAESGPGEDLLLVEKSAVATVVRADTLSLGLRYLQQRIPGFTHLSVRETRTMSRGAHRNREIVDAGIQMAAVWESTALLLGRSAEDLREEADQTREWDETIRDARALLDGMEAANLSRKHRLGSDILKLYSVIGGLLRHPGPETAYVAPYYEQMRSLYLKRLKKRKKGEPPDGDAAGG